MKSINTKNKLFFQSKLENNFKPVFIRYRNKLTTVIRSAKQQYYKNTLNSVKTNSAKLWVHLNSLIKAKSNKYLPIAPENLNAFFSFAFKQAPLFPKGQKHTVKSTSSKNSLYLRPTICDEVISNMLTISNSRLAGSNGIRLYIIKTNICNLAP